MRRRDFLAAVTRAGVASAALSSVPAWMRRATAAPAPPAELIERNDWPEHWETTLSGLDHAWLTSNPRFFVRSHLTVPTIEPKSWRLEVAGKVRTPLQMSLDELRGLGTVERVHTLECAGNGRGRFELPRTSGTQWDLGAVGNARWGGVRLATVLERAGLEPEGKHVWFEAADRATLPSVPPFLRSIPLDKAMADVLLADRMNGEPLPRLHGAPLRAIVPGWFGMASTKWVTKVRVEEAPSDNHFMVKGYRYVYPGGDPTQAEPVEEMRIKSVITRPLEGARLPLGTVRVQGFAWAGSKGVKLVEISSDGGKSWQPAGFMPDQADFAWRQWATEIDVKTPRRLTVMVRALDGAGEAQPVAAKPNAGGYGNNSIHVVNVRVG